MTQIPDEIRITDPYIRKIVELQRQKRGDSTSTKTAARLIVERVSQLELIEQADSTQPAADSAPASR